MFEGTYNISDIYFLMVYLTHLLGSAGYCVVVVISIIPVMWEPARQKPHIWLISSHLQVEGLTHHISCCLVIDIANNDSHWLALHLLQILYTIPNIVILVLKKYAKFILTCLALAAVSKVVVVWEQSTRWRNSQYNRGFERSSHALNLITRWDKFDNPITWLLSTYLIFSLKGYFKSKVSTYLHTIYTIKKKQFDRKYLIFHLKWFND